MALAPGSTWARVSRWVQGVQVGERVGVEKGVGAKVGAGVDVGIAVSTGRSVGAAEVHPAITIQAISPASATGFIIVLPSPTELSGVAIGEG